MQRTKKEHVISKDEKQAADLKKGDFFIPLYQRNFVWQSKNKTLFLESIPFMFFADCDNGKQEVINGTQRMQTLVEFHNNKLQFSGLKKLTKLNGL